MKDRFQAMVKVQMHCPTGGNFPSNEILSSNQSAIMKQK